MCYLSAVMYTPVGAAIHVLVRAVKCSGYASNACLFSAAYWTPLLVLGNICSC